MVWETWNFFVNRVVMTQTVLKWPLFEKLYCQYGISTKGVGFLVTAFTWIDYSCECLPGRQFWWTVWCIVMCYRTCPYTAPRCNTKCDIFEVCEFGNDFSWVDCCWLSFTKLTCCLLLDLCLFGLSHLSSVGNQNSKPSCWIQMWESCLSRNTNLCSDGQDCCRDRLK